MCAARTPTAQKALDRVCARWELGSIDEFFDQLDTDNTLELAPRPGPVPEGLATGLCSLAFAKESIGRDAIASAVRAALTERLSASEGFRRVNAKDIQKILQHPQRYGLSLDPERPSSKSMIATPRRDANVNQNHHQPSAPDGGSIGPGRSPHNSYIVPNDSVTPITWNQTSQRERWHGNKRLETKQRGLTTLTPTLTSGTTKHLSESSKFHLNRSRSLIKDYVPSRSSSPPVGSQAGPARRRLRSSAAEVQDRSGSPSYARKRRLDSMGTADQPADRLVSSPSEHPHPRDAHAITVGKGLQDGLAAFLDTELPTWVNAEISGRHERIAELNRIIDGIRHQRDASLLPGIDLARQKCQKIGKVLAHAHAIPDILGGEGFGGDLESAVSRVLDVTKRQHDEFNARYNELMSRKRQVDSHLEHLLALKTAGEKYFENLDALQKEPRHEKTLGE